MRSLSRNPVAAFVLILALIMAMIAGGIYGINERAIHNLIVSNAQATSQSLAQHLEGSIADIDAIARGEKPSAQTLAVIAGARARDDVLNFKLFDSKGVQVLDAADPAQTAFQGDSLAVHKPEALVSALAGTAHVEVEKQDISGTKTLVAETYVPVLKGGKLTAILEVYVDQSRNEAQFREAFSLSPLLMALLAGIGFAIPSYALYRLTRQKINSDAHAAFLESHDGLTELPNRRSFAQKLTRKLAETTPQLVMTALHFVDIDHFKEINDRFGSEAADELLRSVAERLNDVLRDGDMAARLGGNEFAIAQFGFENETQVGTVIDILTHALSVPFRLPDGETAVTFSIGTAVGPQDGRNAEQLIRNASTAVHVLKARGRNGHCRFEPEFDAELQKRLDLEALVRDATAEMRFELYFQPLFDVNSAELKGFEALLRLRDDNGKHVPPDVFIPVAEEIGLIDEIGTWVLENACATAATWPGDAKISVNLSAAQFKRHSVCGSTRRALQKSGLDPQRLYLEITESLLMANSAEVLEQLRELKHMGVSIVMDDFGSGYSSLGYMLKFPFDRIKIDRSFISGLAANQENSRDVVQTIIALGHTLNMTVTAEGVETLSQANALREMNCDDAQGYLFGRPVPATEIAAIFMKQFSGELRNVEAARRNVA